MNSKLGPDALRVAVFGHVHSKLDGPIARAIGLAQFFSLAAFVVLGKHLRAPTKAA